jgi:hypothetical protein
MAGQCGVLSSQGMALSCIAQFRQVKYRYNLVQFGPGKVMPGHVVSCCGVVQFCIVMAQFRQVKYSNVLARHGGAMTRIV